MHSRATVLALCLAVAGVARADDPASSLRVYQQPLGNGLQLVLAPDPTVTDVVVHVRYAGMTDDATPGMTHLIEKLAALGTVHHKAGEHDALIDAAGGFSTSSTTLEALSFVTQVPAEQLPLALWLEAERMAGLADGITEKALADAKAAIAGEYKAAYEIEPYALLPRAVRVAMFGGEGAIARDPLGDGKSLDGMSLDQVRKAVRERIRPNGATLVVAGNFDVATARQTVKRYVGWIPDDRHAAAEVPCCTRLLKTGAGTTTEVADASPGVVVAYHLPHREGDDRRFAVLGRILASAANTSLVRALVDTGRCSDVHVEVSDEALEVWATPVANADPVAVATDIRTHVREAALEMSRSGYRAEQARRAVEIERLQVLENLAGRARSFSKGATATSTTIPAMSIGPVLVRGFWEERAITIIARPVQP